MSNITELKTRPAQVVQSVVERLEEMLQAAKEGKLAAVAIAGLAWSETDHFGALLGAISRLEYRINQKQPTL